MKHKKNYKPGRLDNCQTPGYAVDPLERFIHKSWMIWEPAKGERYLSSELISRGYQVFESGIEEDFFEFEPDIHWDVIVTNPPYSLKFPWIERCYEFGKPWFLLLPVECMGTASAQEMFREFGVNVIYTSKRINFKMPFKGWKTHGAQFPTAWYFWLGFESHDIYYHDYSYLTKEIRESYEI
jgi:hypothetical protein